MHILSSLMSFWKERKNGRLSVISIRYQKASLSPITFLHATEFRASKLPESCAITCGRATISSVQRRKSCFFTINQMQDQLCYVSSQLFKASLCVPHEVSAYKYARITRKNRQLLPLPGFPCSRTKYGPPDAFEQIIFII